MMSELANGRIGSALDRPTESILGIGYTLLISSEETGGAFELMKFVVPAGHGPLPHLHRREDECFYVVEGEFDVTIGEETFRAGPGTYAQLPRNQTHAFRNVTDSHATFLCWVIPGNLGGFFDSFKHAWPLEDEHPPALNETDIQNMMAAAEKYEIEIQAGG